MHPDDQLIIETPEQTAVEFPLAGIGSRGLALVIDTLLQAGAVIVLILLGVWLDAAAFLPATGKQWVYAIISLAAFVLEFGYFALFEAIWNGRTPGKRWTHLRVIDDSGRPLSVQQAILRNLIRIVDFMPALYTVGIISSFLSGKHKRLGDYLAGTVVVRQQPLQKGRPLWAAVPASAPPLMPSLRLTPAELEVVEAFLERRASLAPDVRALVAREIAERLGRRYSAPAEVWLESEKFLESLGEQGRSLGRVFVMPEASSDRLV